MELAALWLAERSTAFNWFLHARWANTLQFLGAVLALAFSVLWDQVRVKPQQLPYIFS